MNFSIRVLSEQFNCWYSYILSRLFRFGKGFYAVTTKERRVSFPRSKFERNGRACTIVTSHFHRIDINHLLTLRTCAMHSGETGCSYVFILSLSLSFVLSILVFARLYPLSVLFTKIFEPWVNFCLLRETFRYFTNAVMIQLS